VSGGFDPPGSVHTSRLPSAGELPSGFSVRFFPADAPRAPDFSKGPTSPVFLARAGSVRFVVELVLGDDEQYWRAPFVDRVQLDYEQMPR